MLWQEGISNSVRAERGDDIAAACGQLRTREDGQRQQTSRVGEDPAQGR
jgi:23S rRNA (adenine2503-C2)-methyltransferase